MIEQALLELQREFTKQTGHVEEMVKKSIRVLTDRDPDLAREVLEVDEPKCNHAEIEIEGKAIEIIALFAPKAGNMREVIAIIKANKDLERIGDQAVNITQNAQYLISRPPVKPLIDIPRMANIVCSMIADSLNAFTQNNPELAQKTLLHDDLVDDLNDQITRELLTYMASDPATIERSMRLIMISKNLERIGDEATNLAEEFIYCMTGDDVRHHENEGLETWRE
ncbi:phosphate signaling complex protein PhoU [bacterium]|nr:phosphate signaling complex protein PhoU [bacterium]